MVRISRFYTRSILAGLSILLLTACGEGGGGSGGSAQTPVANAISVSVDRDTPMAINIAAEPGNLLGNAPSTVTATDPANGTVAVSGSTVTYTPDQGYLGVDSFDYTITDADGETATATVTITVLDTVAPTATIKFPGAVALTQVNSVLITGTANDASMITRVTVAGTDAITTDGCANWRAIVPLMPGDNTLSIETTDEFSNINSAAAALSVTFNGPNLERLDGLTLDAANGSVLLVDSGLDAVVAMKIVNLVSLIPGACAC